MNERPCIHETKKLLSSQFSVEEIEHTNIWLTSKKKVSEATTEGKIPKLR